jgi:hypothetical protein
VNQPRELERVTIDPATSGTTYYSPIDCDVLAVAGHTVALEAVEKQLALKLPESIEKAYLLFDREGRTIAFRGRLLTVDPPGDLRFVVEHPETRRVATRVTVELDGKVTAADGSSIEVRTVNLSADGVLFAGTEAMTPGDNVTVTLQLAADEPPSEATATVVRMAGGNRFAIQFDPGEKAIRRRLGVFTVEHNRRLLHRESDDEQIEPEPEF